MHNQLIFVGSAKTTQWGGTDGPQMVLGQPRVHTQKELEPNPAPHPNINSGQTNLTVGEPPKYEEKARCS